MSRETRDILAECMRRERYGLIRPLWSDLISFDDATAEEVRRRADHLIRLLADYGVQLVQAGEPAPVKRPDRPTIIMNAVFGAHGVERSVCAADRGFDIVIKKGSETAVEQNFTLTDVMLNAGNVLADDPAAKTIKGLGRQLAAATEIYRLNAAGMGGGK